MAVRAKFVCKSKDDNGNVRLEAVVGGSEENDEFFKNTPSGSLVINTLNDEALEEFEEGAEYYLDFSRV